MTSQAIIKHPLSGVSSHDVTPIPVGVTYASQCPDPKRYILRVNGDYVLRADWELVTEQGDVLEWIDGLSVPQNRETWRTVLQVAIVIIAAYVGGPWGAAIAVAGTLALNALLPPRLPPAPAAPGDIYTASLNGNLPRIDDAIWKVCGRVRVTPPFAAMPYGQFLPSDEDNPTVDNDQYYYALFALTIDECDVEKAFIGRTPVIHYDDVIRAAKLEPGDQPAVVKANVVTSSETSGLRVKGRIDEDDLAFYVGPYVATKPGDKAVRISIDIAADQGLGGAEGETRTVTWEVACREINDYGAPIGDWFNLGAEARGPMNTNTVQRWTSTYDLPTPMRCEIKVVRTDQESREAKYRDGISWIGMRAELLKPAPLNANVTHFEVVMRASQQLSAENQRDFSMILRGKCRTLKSKPNPPEWEDGVVFTRNPAWWLLDLLTSTTWGLGLPDDRIDLSSFRDLAERCDQRQDRFDFCFSQEQDAWSAIQMIAQVCRARVFRRGTVYTVARDERVVLPVAALTSRNTAPGSMTLSSGLPDHERPDGYVVQYLSNVTWDLETVECPCPGFTVTNTDDPRYDAGLPMMSNPVWIRYDGITGYTHALREGIYQAASLAYRREMVSADVELEAMLLAVLDPIRWMPRMIGYGQTGDVAFWDPDALVMGLTEPPDWSQAPLFLQLRRDDNTLTTAVEVTPGPTAYDVVLPAAPDFELVLDNGMRERPIFLLGHETGAAEIAKVAAISHAGQTDDGAEQYTVTSMIDDDRVHTADIAYLPTPGEIQDPIDEGNDYPDEDGGGFAIIVRLTEHIIAGGNEGIPDLDNRGGYAEFSLFADGRAGWESQNGTEVILDTQSGYYPAEWITSAPSEPAVTAQYECHFEPYGTIKTELESYGVVFTGDSVNTWLTMDADRTVRMFADKDVSDTMFGADKVQFPMTVRIRRIATPAVILAERRVTLIVKFDDTDTGSIDGGGY